MDIFPRMDMRMTKHHMTPNEKCHPRNKQEGESEVTVPLDAGPYGQHTRQERNAEERQLGCGGSNELQTEGRNETHRDPS